MFPPTRSVPFGLELDPFPKRVKESIGQTIVLALVHYLVMFLPPKKFPLKKISRLAIEEVIDNPSGTRTQPYRSLLEEHSPKTPLRASDNFSPVEGQLERRRQREAGCDVPVRMR